MDKVAIYDLRGSRGKSGIQEWKPLWHEARDGNMIKKEILRREYAKDVVTKNNAAAPPEPNKGNDFSNDEAKKQEHARLFSRDPKLVLIFGRFRLSCCGLCLYS